MRRDKASADLPRRCLRRRTGQRVALLMQLGDNIRLRSGGDEGFTRFLCGPASFSGRGASKHRQLIVAAFPDWPSVRQVIKSLVRSADQLRRTVSNSYAYRICPMLFCIATDDGIHSASPRFPESNSTTCAAKRSSPVGCIPLGQWRWPDDDGPRRAQGERDQQTPGVSR